MFITSFLVVLTFLILTDYSKLSWGEVLNLPVEKIILISLLTALFVSEVEGIGTYGEGLARFDGAKWTVYNTSNSGLPDD